MESAREVEGGPTFHSESGLAKYTLHQPDDTRLIARQVINFDLPETAALFVLFMHRHEIGYLGGRSFAAKTGYEDIGLGEVNLAMIDRIGGRDEKPAALFVIKEAIEHSGRIEERQAQPVDRAVVAHERGRVHVPDQSVVFDPFICHEPSL